MSQKIAEWKGAPGEKIAIPVMAFNAVIDAALPLIDDARRVGGPVCILVPDSDGVVYRMRFRNADCASTWLLEVGARVQSQLQRNAEAMGAQELRNAMMAASGASPRSKVDHVIKDANGEITGMRTEYIY